MTERRSAALFSVTEEDMLLLDRAKLVQRVYDEAVDNTESFEGDLGMYLAYLFPAILKGGSIELFQDVDAQVEVLGVLKEVFPAEHPVWEFINTPEKS